MQFSTGRRAAITGITTMTVACNNCHDSACVDLMDKLMIRI
jgi:hypothetical protein